jgi:hypothetical protein
MDVADALAELFGAPREDFTALRDSWVKRARAQQRADIADQLRTLRKPTMAAWLVNQVSRRHPDDLAALIDVGDALRTAHHELAGDRLRALSRQRQELSRQLTRRARAIAAEAGHSFGDAAVDQVESTWTSAAADTTAADLVRAGHLSAALTPDSEQDWLAVAVSSTPPRERPAPKSAPAQPKADPPRAKDRSALRDARHDLQQAQRTLDQAERAQGNADRAAEAAAVATKKLREQLAELERQVAEAAEEERESTAHAAEAARTTKAAQRSVRTAQRKVEKLDDE